MDGKMETYIYVPVIVDGENEIPMGDTERFKGLAMMVFFESGADAQACIDKVIAERKEVGQEEKIEFKIMKYQRV